MKGQNRDLNNLLVAGVGVEISPTHPHSLSLSLSLSLFLSHVKLEQALLKEDQTNSKITNTLIFIELSREPLILILCFVISVQTGVLNLFYPRISSYNYKLVTDFISHAMLNYYVNLFVLYIYIRLYY